MRDNLSACSLTYMLSLHSLFSYLHTFGDKQSMKVQKVFFLLTPIVVSKAILFPDSYRNTSARQYSFLLYFKLKQDLGQYAKSLHMLGKGVEAVADQWGVSGRLSRLTAPVHRCHHIGNIGKLDSTIVMFAS